MVLPTLLLTRPHDSGCVFAAMLDPAALALVDVVIAPLMEIVATGAPVALGGRGGVIFTSANGVIHGPAACGLTAHCVGEQTTRKARAKGWDAEHCGDTAQELIATLTARSSIQPLLHLGGVHTRGEIAQILTQAGIPTDHVAVYDQLLVPLHAQALIALERACIVPVFSPRSAVELVRQTRGKLAHAHIFALSGSVAAGFDGEPTASMMVLPKPQTSYMLKAVENLCLTLSLP